ncbi:hypothetical protein J4217_00465 [Candidatus Pacearchaeota archaeon]|nr:hypothetical protein [Candidatus Pacearchaeota archaeon]
METTIAVKESTAQILARLRERMKARSMDEVIITILKKGSEIPKSQFGADRDIKSFSRKDRAKFHEL